MSAEKTMLNYAEMGSFFENMAMMVKAGITVNEAVGLLRDETEPEHKAMVGTLTELSEQLSVGSSLEDAMRGAGTFPDYANDMIGVAEYTGRLEDTLFHLSEYYRSEESMKKTLISAVRYPVILLFLVIAVLIVMLKLVFPAFYGVYNNLTGSLSASSFRYIDASFTICRIMLVVMIVLVAVLLIGAALWRRGKKESVQGFLNRIPVFAQLFENLDLYRFTSCFDMFISSGELQDEALKKSMPVVETEDLKKKLERCTAKMEEGMSFSQEAYEEKLYDPINNRMLIPAERSGMLDSILQKILRSLKENNDAYISRIANTIEPLLTGLLMIFIGIMLISLMIPLIGIMNSIG